MSEVHFWDDIKWLTPLQILEGSLYPSNTFSYRISFWKFQNPLAVFPFSGSVFFLSFYFSGGKYHFTKWKSSVGEQGSESSQKLRIQHFNYTEIINYIFGLFLAFLFFSLRIYRIVCNQQGGCILKYFFRNIRQGCVFLSEWVKY